MRDLLTELNFDVFVPVSITLLLLVSVLLLRSIAPSLFPSYFVYIAASIVIFFLFLNIDFEISVLFSKHLYILSIIFLILPLLIGQITRGAIRWIPIGSLTVQPSEIVRPFLLLFFATYLTEKPLDKERLVKAFSLFLIPFFLILIQPSLGVAVLTTVGFLGVFLASTIKKKYIFMGLAALIFISPLFWFVLAPYQKERIEFFLNPSSDPYGAGYNSIQSKIAVGSGKFTGRGLGEGVQTQLAFLPERHTDFIFASIAEEMGFVGAGLVLLGLFVIFWRLTHVLENSKNPTARAFVSGVVLLLFAETVIHVGMNMGLLPITGIPLPFVSAGGSALLGTMMAVGIALTARRKITY